MCADAKGLQPGHAKLLGPSLVIHFPTAVRNLFLAWSVDFVFPNRASSLEIARINTVCTVALRFRQRVLGELEELEARSIHTAFVKNKHLGMEETIGHHKTKSKQPPMGCNC